MSKLLLSIIRIVGIFAGIAAISSLAFVAQSRVQEDIDLGDIENIHGIPYPRYDRITYISEHLAHTDAYLTQPVIGKTLVLTVTFIPHNTQTLSVGIRENSFWLSYPKHTLYSADNTTKPNIPITKTVEIPLTDKLQDTDRSVDIMLFARTPHNTSDQIDKGIHDRTHWTLLDMDARVKSHIPSYARTKNYVKSIVKKERPL